MTPEQAGEAIANYVRLFEMCIRDSGGMHPVRTGIWMAAGLAVCYALGTAWFMAVMPYTLAQSLAACVTPFVVPDIVKGVAAYSFCKVLSARMAKAGL